MSLQGSLDTFALSDVLTLLATTGKSGELRVAGPRLDGRLFLAGGELAGASAGRAEGAVDVLFELLRLPEGSFVFTDGIPTVDGPPEPVAPALEEASRRLEVWREIEAVVPSLDVRVRLVAELPDAEVTVTAERWQALVAVAEGGVVGVVAEVLRMGEFDACATVKDLVDAGLVSVLAPAEALAPVEAFASVGGTAEAEDAGEPAEHEAIDAGQIDGVVDEEAEAPGWDAVVTAESGEDAADPADAVNAFAALAESDVAPVVTVVGPVGDEDDDDDDDPAERLAALAAMAGRAGPGLPADDGELASAASVAPVDGEALDDLHEVDEPLNRGLLLKFLSSVRS